LAGAALDALFLWIFVVVDVAGPASTTAGVICSGTSQPNCPPPPDLNCSDIPHRRFTVLPPDPHNFDGSNDGVGCES
jgi:hypothetical protein